MFFEEGGKTGTNLNRSKVSRLQHSIRQREFDVLLTVKIDRLTRDTEDFPVLERLLAENGIIFYPINDHYDPSNAQGWFMRHMSIGQAEYESRVTSERTRLAMDYRASQGLWNGGYIYGYRPDSKTEKLVPHPEESVVVKTHIFDAFESLGSVGRVLDRPAPRTHTRRSLTRISLIA